MTKSRLEAFGDGVLAIIITIMVLTLKTPETDNLEALLENLPGLLAYLLSFTYVAIYWNNHHHLTSSLEDVSSGVLWANMLSLFFLSLIPWSTSWIAYFYTSQLPVMFYGLVLLGTAIAYLILQHQIIKASPSKEALKGSFGSDIKGKISLLLYIIAILISLVAPIYANLFYIIVAMMWFIPDKRISKVLTNRD